jgi:hypothetical protein
MAYTSLDDEYYQVLVQPFPPTGAKYQVSADGGRDPVWSPDGTQLFLMQNRDLVWQLVSVEVTTSPGLAFGTPKVLPIGRAVAFGARAYDITPDGQKFLVTVPPPQGSDEARRNQINVTLDWFVELKQRLPVR